ncbi:hypothetical protein COCNU_scaffold010818G000010 [Cocos nucifera]|nr:hypothetical protein [Cocos nucifera]
MFPGQISAQIIVPYGATLFMAATPSQNPKPLEPSSTVTSCLPVHPNGLARVDLQIAARHCAFVFVLPPITGGGAPPPPSAARHPSPSAPPSLLRASQDFGRARVRPVSPPASQRGRLASSHLSPFRQRESMLRALSGYLKAVGLMISLSKAYGAVVI